MPDLHRVGLIDLNGTQLLKVWDKTSAKSLEMTTARLHPDHQ
jgi:hypothetical protein